MPHPASLATSHEPLFLSAENMVLATDLYQLTMMAAYLDAGMEEPATFELFVRRLPSCRSYLLAAGLEQCLHYLMGLRFDGAAIDYLRSHDVFAHVPAAFFERLRAYRFTGDVDAVTEGTPIFANEPLLRVRAPLFEAQLVETYLLCVLNYQTNVATKAARVARAAQGRGCVDFGTRRAHGPQAGLYAARAAYIGGMVGTSNVLAARQCSIPVKGTAAHAFTMACPSEEEAFRRYHATFPDHTTLLIDTYDTIEGAHRATAIKGELKGVRLDSGDLAELAKQVRVVLNDAGRTEAHIVASGDLNEYKIAALLEAGAPIDLFGVGTELVTVRDNPALGGVYKLVSRVQDGVELPAMKLSEGKMTYPGAKQIWRYCDADGTFLRDVMHLADTTPEVAPRAPTALLVPIIEDGRLVYACPPLDDVRAYASDQLARLPTTLHQNELQGDYEVRVGQDVQKLVEQLRGELR